MISTGYYPIYPHRVGAIEPFIYGLSKNLSLTNNVDVFGIGKGEEKIGNLHIQTFPYGENILTSLKSIFGPRLAYQIPFNAYLVENIFNLHKKKPIDILHIHDANSGFAATLSKLALNIPYICSVHNELRSNLPIRASDKVLAVSEYIKTFLIEQRKFSLKKVEVLNPAIYSDLYRSKKSIKQAKHELGLADHNVVLFVGRKCPEKGPQILINALPEIVKHAPNTLAILIGPDYSFFATSCSYTNFLISRAEKLHVKGNVIFEGFLSDDALKLYYNAADVCVFPSIWQEAFGVVLLEALAYEKPVIASRVGGIPEIIRDGKTGLLTSPGDSQQLAQAIVRLLNNPAFGKELGANGRKLVETQFSFEAVGSHCLEIYKKVLSEQNNKKF
jgi:glycosyltransferase involved in cell wall biosynthesis